MTGAGSPVPTRRSRKLTCRTFQRWDVVGGFPEQFGQVPTLEQLLESIPTETLLNLDLKGDHPSLVVETLRILRRYNAERRTTLASFRTRTALEVRARGFIGNTALSISRAPLGPGCLAWLAAIR